MLSSPEAPSDPAPTQPEMVAEIRAAASHVNAVIAPLVTAQDTSTSLRLSGHRPGRGTPPPPRRRRTLGPTVIIFEHESVALDDQSIGRRSSHWRQRRRALISAKGPGIVPLAAGRHSAAANQDTDE